MPISGETSGSAARKSGRTFYGWWILGVVSSLYAVANGVYWVGFSFYFLPVKRDLALSTAAMSLAPGLARLVSGLQGPLAGYLVDRLGPRFMIVFGGGLSGAGFLLLAFTHSYLTFLLVYLGLVVVGMSGGFDQGILAVTNRWFVRRKARAMSFLWVGLALGSAFIAPVVGLVVVNLGWREAAAISGAVILALLVPAFLVVRDRPEGLGLLPDGEEAAAGRGGAGLPVTSSVGDQQYAAMDLSASQGFRTPSYWLLALALGLRVAAHAALMIHFVPIVVWKGQSETTAALLLSIYGLASIPLCLLVGWAGDRWSKQRVTSGGMVLAGVGLVILMLSDGRLWQLVLFIAFFTVADSSGLVAWALVGDFFGRKAFATLLGGMTMVYSLLSAATPVLAGWIFDSSGSYFGALLLIALLFISASLLFWQLPRPKLPVSPVSP